jgi:hypothetical protein
MKRTPSVEDNTGVSQCHSNCAFTCRTPEEQCHNSISVIFAGETLKASKEQSKSKHN